MSIALTTPVVLAEIGGAPIECSHLKIVAFRILLEAKQIDIDVKMGNLIDGVFQEASKTKRYSIQDFPEVKRIVSVDPDGTPKEKVIRKETLAYSNMIKAKSPTDGVLYNDIAQHLYEWLIAENPNFLGTIG